MVIGRSNLEPSNKLPDAWIETRRTDADTSSTPDSSKRWTTPSVFGLHGTADNLSSTVRS